MQFSILCIGHGTRNKRMIKTNALFTALIVTWALSRAGFAFPENFAAGAFPVTERVTVADGDAALRIDCPSGFCWRRQSTGFRFFMGEVLRDWLKQEFSHRYTFEVSGTGSGLLSRNRSTGLDDSRVRNPFSIFGKVTSKYGWIISDPRMPSLPSGKDRGFGLGYGTAINIDLSSRWVFSAEWERHRYEMINEKSNVTLFLIGFNYAF